MLILYFVIGIVINIISFKTITMDSIIDFGYSLIFGEVIVYRIPDVTDNIVNNFDFIVDVSKQYDGIKFFDHHQELPLYADGVKPCGATLFAEAIWENKEEYKEIIYPYILRPIAVVDNGQHELFSTYPNHLFGWVETLNPVWNDNSQSGDSQFLIALQMALTIFQQEIAQLRSAKDAIEVLANAKRVENGKIIILPQSVPTWKEEYSKDVLSKSSSSKRVENK